MDKKLDFQIDKQNLIKALEITTKIMKGKPSTPIFAFSHFTAKDNKLFIETTEIDEAIKSSIEAQIEQEGEFITNPKLLLSMLKTIDETDISISQEADNNYITIQSGWNVTTLPVGNSDEFPKFPAVEGTEEMEFDTEELKDLIQSTTFACSKDEARPLFTGAYLDISQKQIAASNTHIMALAKVAPMEATDSNKKIVIPAKTLDKIANTDIKDKTIKINFNQNRIYITFDNTTFVSNLIHGAYPDVNRVIPKDYKIKCKLNKEKFEKILNRIKIFAENDYQTIIIETNKEENTIQLSSKSTKGTSVEAIKTEELKTEEDIKIAFNSNYLIQIAKRVKGNDIFILMNTPVSPVLITNNKLNDDKYIITPIRIA